jgi:hypothetical protein
MALLPEDQRRARSRALQAHHAAWEAEQLAAGIDGPVPPGRGSPSDYNQHVTDFESDPDALDEFYAGVDRIVNPE